MASVVRLSGIRDHPVAGESVKGARQVGVEIGLGQDLVGELRDVGVIVPGAHLLRQ